MATLLDELFKQSTTSLLDEILQEEWTEEVLSPSQLNDAVSYNNKNAISVGWQNYLDQIIQFLGFEDYPPDQLTFAQAVYDWQKSNMGAQHADGRLGPKTWQAIKNNPAFNKTPTDHKNDNSNNGAFTCWIEDLQSKAKPQPGSMSKNPRSIALVDSVVLHQMAFSRGSDLNKYLKVRVHYIIMPDGKIGQLYPDTALLWASNGFNKRSVAIEFAGNFPNTKGKCYLPNKFGCHQLTDAQVQAGRCLLAALKNKLPNMRYVFAHRQSNINRANDPGPDIWYQVGEWAIKNLGYHPDSRKIKTGSGQPIPEEWMNWGNA